MKEYLYKEDAAFFKALADETRLRIVEMLCHGEMCACEILEPLNITQPTLSYHMKVLSTCGLVECRRLGSWMKYSINKEKMKKTKEHWELCMDKGKSNLVQKQKYKKLLYNSFL